MCFYRELGSTEGILRTDTNASKPSKPKPYCLNEETNTTYKNPGNCEVGDEGHDRGEDGGAAGAFCAAFAGVFFLLLGELPGGADNVADALDAARAVDAAAQARTLGAGNKLVSEAEMGELFKVGAVDVFFTSAFLPKNRDSLVGGEGRMIMIPQGNNSFRRSPRLP